MVCSLSSIISSRLPRLSFRGDIPDTEAFKSVFFFELHSGGTPAVVIDPEPLGYGGSSKIVLLAPNMVDLDLEFLLSYSPISLLRFIGSSQSKANTRFSSSSSAERSISNTATQLRGLLTSSWLTCNLDVEV